MNILRHHNRILMAFALAITLGTTSCKQASFDEQCAQQAQEFTEKQCPQRIAEGIVLDSMTYAPSLRCLNYYYTLSGKIDDAKLIKNNESLFREQLLSSITNSVELKRPKSEGISFRYIYTSKSTRKQLLSVTIRKEEYSK